MDGPGWRIRFSSSRAPPSAHPIACQVDGSVVAWIALLRLGGVRQDRVCDPQKFDLPVFWGGFFFSTVHFPHRSDCSVRRGFTGRERAMDPNRQPVAHGRGPFRVASCSKRAARWFWVAFVFIHS